MNNFRFSPYYIQDKGFQLTQVMLVLLAMESEQHMTHRQRNHYNTVLKDLTMELNKLLQPRETNGDPVNIGDIPF